MSRSFAAIAGLLTFLVAFGGCVTREADDGGAQTHEFDLFVEAGSSGTVALYPRNDLSQQRAVAITFKANPDDPQAIPGPEIRVREGDTVIIHVQNPNALSHTLHLHGGLIPWEEDGVDYLTQYPIRQGEEHTYTYANLKAGTYWYHCHVDAAHHTDFGLYGALIVEERHPPVKADRDYVVFLDEFDSCHVHGNLDPVPVAGNGQESSADYQGQSDCYYRFLMDNLAQNRAVSQAGQTVNSTVPQAARDTYCPAMVAAFASVPEPARSNGLMGAGCMAAHDHGATPVQQTPRQWWPETHPLYNPMYNTYLVNGKAFPDTPVFPMKPDETVRFRLINAGNLMHSWHPHGHAMKVIAKDGYLLDSPYFADTLTIGPGERYDFLVEANNPGLWIVHDGFTQYTANDNVHPGGLAACMPYDGFEGIDAFAMATSADCATEALRILQERGDHRH